MKNKFVCENCGKEYIADSHLGLWRKDNSQSKGRGSGYSVERFCCYECGKEYNINKIKEGGYTSKNKGNGIGILLSNEIVSAHMGELIYDSKVGEGTTTILKLPLYKFS